MSNYKKIAILKARGYRERQKYTQHTTSHVAEKLYQDFATENFVCLGNKIWQALMLGDITKVVKLYNVALAELPYDTSEKEKREEYHNEYWYRSLFIMLLRGAGIISYAEVRTHIGRSDLVIQVLDKIIVLEFKFAHNASEIEKKISEGIKQIAEKGYASGYIADKWRVICAVVVANDKNMQAEVRIVR